MRTDFARQKSTDIDYSNVKLQNTISKVVLSNSDFIRLEYQFHLFKFARILYNFGFYTDARHHRQRVSPQRPLSACPLR